MTDNAGTLSGDGERLPIRRALVSVFDKTGLEALARALCGVGAEIVSTGSTASAIAAFGLPVTAVEAVTGAPEMLDGRVKTLHPRIHAGLLADRRRPEHRQALDDHGIAPFDLVVSSLYPFEQAAAAPGASADDVIEQIDVGGPSMVRAAAKNHASVAVVTDPSQYAQIERALAGGGTTLAERRDMAARAFARTAAYDAAIATWFTAHAGLDPLGPALTLGGTQRQALRYGENPHQAAAFYATGAWGLAGARQVAGKELSYNNLLDADAALGLAREFADRPFAVIVKHTNPCGAAGAGTLAAAYAAAVEGDPVSAFGGVVALTRALDRATAERIAGLFTEVVLAPAIEPEALEALASKPSLRLLEADLAAPAGWLSARSVAGGMLVHDADTAPADPGAWKTVTGVAPTVAEMADLELAWIIAKHLKSNAIALVDDGRLVGAGAGQMSRVDSVRIAVEKAGERAQGAVAASDAFFPFPDGVEALGAAGVRAVVQPGGSVRDDEVTAAAEKAGMTMLHTGRRHFRH